MGVGVQFRTLYYLFREISFVVSQHDNRIVLVIKITIKRSTLFTKKLFKKKHPLTR